MPRHSKYRRMQKSERRRTVWHDARTSTVSLGAAAGIVTEFLLFIPLEDHEAATVTRIVGNVSMWLEASPVAPVALSWGIYKKASGTVSSLAMNPFSALDNESEHWLYKRHVWTRGFTGSLGSISDQYETQQVDVKTQRKVDEGDAIALAMFCADNYEFAVNLRMLLKLT